MPILTEITKAQPSHLSACEALRPSGHRYRCVTVPRRLPDVGRVSARDPPRMLAAIDA
jgi:hypothetical protein